MKLKDYINERNIFIISLLFGITVLILPYNFSDKDIMLGDFSYYHARMADDLIENGIPKTDYLSYYGRPYLINPYHLTLAGFGYFLNVELASRILPFIVGLFSLVLFYLILRNLKLKLEQRALILLVLILSPLFIYTFSISNEDALAILFLLMGAYFFNKKKKFFFVVSFIAWSLSILFNLLNIAVIILLMATYYLKNRNARKIFLSLSIILLLSLPYYYYVYSNFGIPEKITFTKVNIIQHSISDLGSLVGFSAFTLLLSLVGLVATWKNKKKLIFAYLMIVTLFVTSFYFDYSNISLNMLLSVFAGIGFYALIRMRWQIKLIKKLTILVLVCGLVFSTLSYLTRINELQPNKDVVGSLEWLENNSEPDEIVFSHYSKGFWIETIAKRPVVMDSLFMYSPNPNERFNDSREIFNEVHLEKSTELLQKYNIRYIWIDQEMKDGLVWTKEKQGLLFLFRNKETFEKVFEKNQTEIWAFKK